MTETQRTIKRLIIIFIYLTIIALIAEGLYLLLRTPPTCSDGKRNQGEEKIDCGGPCPKCEEIPQIENIQIVKKTLIPAGPGKYDALVQIKNPNALFGVASFDYTFDFLGENGEIIQQAGGTEFVMPVETKYILAFNIVLPERPNNFSFNIKSFRWQKFNEYEGPEISVFSKELNLSPGDGPFQVKAKIQNKSGYDFKEVRTKVILKNTQGIPVAINQTSNNDVLVNEEREIIFNWGTPLAGNIDLQNIEVDPEVNIFSNENFMKRYGSSVQYQSYGVND